MWEVLLAMQQQVQPVQQLAQMQQQGHPQAIQAPLGHREHPLLLGHPQEQQEAQAHRQETVEADHLLPTAVDHQPLLLEDRLALNLVKVQQPQTPAVQFTSPQTQQPPLQPHPQTHQLLLHAL